MGEPGLLLLGLLVLRGSWSISEKEAFVHFTWDPHMCDQLGGQRRLDLDFPATSSSRPGDFPGMQEQCSRASSESHQS